MLIKTEILSFVLKQKPSTPPNLMMEVKTLWELCLIQVGPSVSLKRLEMGIFSFLTERDWSRNFVSFVMHIYDAKFQEHCFNISRDIIYSVFPLFSCKPYDVITDLICIIEKCQYLYNKKRYFKKKNAILLYFERPFK